MNTATVSAGPVRDFIGYGQSIPKVEWPNGANVAVNLVVNYEEGSEYSFDRDGENDVHVESSYNFPTDVRDLSRESMYEYGSRAGIWRLMRLFDELGVPCTFYAARPRYVAPLCRPSFVYNSCAHRCWCGRRDSNPHTQMDSRF